MPGRDFGHHGDLTASTEHDKAAVYVMLHGRADEPRDWLRAGEALSAGWLTATEHSVSVLPHSAPIQVVSTRQAMRVILASTGYPYLVLRLGRIDPTDAGPPHAPRLPADQIIEQPKPTGPMRAQRLSSNRCQTLRRTGPKPGRRQEDVTT